MRYQNRSILSITGNVRKSGIGIFWTAYLTTFLLTVTGGSVRSGLKINPSF